MRRRNIIAEIMAEVVIYGGLVATRHEVYCDCMERLQDHLAADWFAMRSPLGSPAEIAYRRSVGLTLAKIIAKERQTGQRTKRRSLYTR